MCFMGEFSMFSVIRSWIECMQRCFSCRSLLILLCNIENIAEYEAYWFMGTLIINP